MAILPCGVHFETYRQHLAYLRTRPQWTVFILLLLLLAGLPQILSIRFIAMISMATMICIAVVGLQITTGYAGLLNLGQSAFMGMGAFVCGSLAVNFNLALLDYHPRRRAGRGPAGGRLRNTGPAHQGLLPGHHHHCRPDHLPLDHHAPAQPLVRGGRRVESETGPPGLRSPSTAISPSTISSWVRRSSCFSWPLTWSAPGWAGP